MCGLTVAWPTLERDRERILEGVLGQVEIAEDAREDRERAPPLLLEDGLDYRAPASARTGTTGRTSILPSFADGILEAQSSASSSDSTSIR